MEEESNPYEIQIQVHRNPLLNYWIGRILELPEANRRLHCYQQAIWDSQDKGRELDLFLELILEELETDWQLCDPSGHLATLASQALGKPAEPYQAEPGQVELYQVEQRVLLVCNHPLGGRDGVVLLQCLSRIFGSENFKALVNEFLLNLPYLRDIFLPISPLTIKSGRRMGQLRQLHRSLEKNGGKGEGGEGRGNRGEEVGLGQDFAQQRALLFFPAGLCSRWHSQPRSVADELAECPQKLKNSALQALSTSWGPLSGVYDLPWRYSFLRLARKHRLNILHLHSSGQNSTRFYRWAKLRQRLRLRFNWEMLLLPQEFLYNRKGSGAGDKRHLRITVGGLLSAGELQGWPRQYDHLWAQLCKHYCYQLPRWLPGPNGREKADEELNRLCHEVNQAVRGL